MPETNAYVNIAIAVNTPKDLKEMLPDIQKLIGGCLAIDPSKPVTLSIEQVAEKEETAKPKAKAKAKAKAKTEEPKADEAAPEKASETSSEDKALLKAFRKLFGETKTKHKSEAFACQCVEAAGFTRGSNDLATFLESVTIDKIPEIMKAMKLGPVDTEGGLEQPDTADAGATVEAATIAVKSVHADRGLDEARATMALVDIEKLSEIETLSPAQRKELVAACIAKPVEDEL